MVGRGAEAPDARLARNRRMRQVLEADPIENLLSRRKVLDKRLGRKIALRQDVDHRRAMDLRKLSLVETSTSIRAGRSVLAHTTPESIDTSPDWTPWVTIGRSAARLI